jgi:hypothetical protein
MSPTAGPDCSPTRTRAEDCEKAQTSLPSCRQRPASDCSPVRTGAEDCHLVHGPDRRSEDSHLGFAIVTFSATGSGDITCAAAWSSSPSPSSHVSPPSSPNAPHALAGSCHTIRQIRAALCDEFGLCIHAFAARPVSLHTPHSARGRLVRGGSSGPCTRAIEMTGGHAELEQGARSKCKINYVS